MVATHSSLHSSSPLFVLVDGHSLAFRSYYAFAKNRDGGLRTSTGTPTSVCYGFLKSLTEVAIAYQPQYMAIAFDLGLPTFRHEADDTYKAGRKETPEDFIEDLKTLHDLLDTLNIQVLTAPGYEADDILATLAQQGSEAGLQVKIVSGDRDLFQLINPDKRISVLYLGTTYWRRGNSSGIPDFSTEQVQEKLGIYPHQVVDYKALCGDGSDNIPGVKGIGDKTTRQLLEKYGTLDGIYAALDEIKGATRKKLEEGKDIAYHSQFMAQLHYNVPLGVTLENCQLSGFDQSRVEALLQQLEFKSFLPKIQQLQVIYGGKSTDKNLVIEDESLSFWTAEETQAAQQESQLPFEVEIIKTEQQLQRLVTTLKTCTNPEFPVAWDTETTALEPRDAQLVGIGCCYGSGKQQVAYIPLGHSIGENLDLNLVLEALRPILESSDYPKVLQNAKYDRLVLRVQGIKLAGVTFETLLASYVLSPETNHGLKSLAQKYLNLNPITYEQLVPKGKTIAEVEVNKVAEYCGMDVYATFHLVPKLREALAQVPRIDTLLTQLEIPLEPVLAEMEFTGIRVDTDYLQELSQQLAQELEQIKETAYQIAGENFNLGSPKQVSQVLINLIPDFEKKARKTQTGYSTDAATLEKFAGVPIVDAIAQYRTLDKLKSTYVDALPQLVRKDTHRVHTSFNQTVTGTGRLSSSNPNLQNIPIRTEFSRQIRKAFLPQEGWLLVSADYSQIELRILAHLSEEPVLIEAYRNNEDIHTVTAKLLFEKDKITSEERRWAKTINFGVIYGMGAIRFARETGLSNAQGKTFIERFNERYPKVFAYLENIQKQVISQGYVETIEGRRRYFEFDSNSGLLKLRGLDPREIDLKAIRLGKIETGILRAAANAPIQGSSADIIKKAMINLHSTLQNYSARMLIQVHDELVFEVPTTEWESLQQIIRETMENAVQLKVPLLVDIQAGNNWMET